MVMGGAVAGAVASPPAVVPSEAEKGLAGTGTGTGVGPAAKGPGAKEDVVSEEFWEDLRGFVLQRIRNEKEAERLVGVFKAAWEKER